MITARNFCHIEIVDDRIAVLFYIEHDGDNIILHQVAKADEATLDLSLSAPADQWDNLWPDKIRFANAAKTVIAEAANLGLSFTP